MSKRITNKKQKHPQAKRRTGAKRGHAISAKTPHYIFGRHAAAEALSANVPLKRALISEKLLLEGRDNRLDKIVSELKRAHIPIETVSNRSLENLAKNSSHQGILLEVEPYTYATLEEILTSCQGKKDALIVLLDHIEDEGNLGAIARTGEVLGAAGLIIPQARSASVGAGAYKASAGAVAHLPIVQVPNLVSIIETLKGEGFWITGATEHTDEPLWKAPLSGRVGLVMGSEKQGISELVLKKCDFLATIPQTGKIESLNVAQAATVFAYEWLRQSSSE